MSSGQTENIGDFLVGHVANGTHWSSPLGSYDLAPYHLDILGIRFQLTLDFIMVGIGVLLALILIIPAARRKNLMPISRFGHAIEAIVEYLRSNLVTPFVGDKESAKWSPFALTLFFFILTLNLVGLIPYAHAATGNISVTGALAIIVFLLINISGIFHNGVIHYLKALAPSDLPLPMLLVMYPIELFSLIAKSATLAIRLFANMAAGHFLIFTLLGLMALMKSYSWSLFSFPMATTMYGFEIFIALLQAYVFTLLSMLFIGSAIHQDH